MLTLALVTGLPAPKVCWPHSTARGACRSCEPPIWFGKPLMTTPTRPAKQIAEGEWIKLAQLVPPIGA